MADNAFVKIGTALLKHQVKKLVGDETLEVIGEELADIGGDKLDAWLGERSTQEEIEKAAQSAQTCFREKVTDNKLQQWMISLPLGNLPKVVEAIDELPSSPNESKLENALRESIALNWKKLSSEQVDNAVNSFLSCLRSALLPIEKQTLMVIGRSVLRTEDKVDLLVRWFEQYIITGKPTEVKQLNPEPVETWNLKHPYAMPPNFTGRVEERKMLADWLNKENENRLFILRALGGFGKSALSWHWLTHDVDSSEWKKVLWWSFYEGDASFEHFIEETLKYLKLEIPQGQRPQVDALLKAMQSQKILLIMDGFERALRAYSSMNAAYQADDGQWTTDDSQFDCVNINAEFFLRGVSSLPNIKSKVLMTTRLTPRAVKPRGEFMLGCREVELTSMQPADAVEFFHKQKIKGTHAEIEAACSPYGYHPLSLRLLAGRILKDFEKPADIIVAQKLKIDGDLVQQKHHVLEVSYNSLPEHEQKLLSAIACFRSPVELKTLEAVAENKETLNNDLQDLRERGLLHFDEKNSRFDLHPIVRRYAYEKLSTADRTDTHKHFVNYYETIPQVTEINSIEDIFPVVELYYHLVKTNNNSRAFNLFSKKLYEILFHQFGANQLIVELLAGLYADDKSGELHLEKDSSKLFVLNALVNASSVTGRLSEGLITVQRTVDLLEKTNDTRNVVITLLNIAVAVQIPTGRLKDAEASIARSKEMIPENSFFEKENAFPHEALGQIYTYLGNWDLAEQEFESAMFIYNIRRVTQSQCVLCGLRALMHLMTARSDSRLRVKNLRLAVECSQRALELAFETSRHPKYVYPLRDFMESYWLLGKSFREHGSLVISEENLSKAITICRQGNFIDYEADILLDLARLRYAQNNYEEAKSLAEEALLITERCGYVLQGADVNLFLAELTLTLDPSPEGRGKARQYAEEALKLATCDGPPYYYKVAYEEAERFLANLK